MDSTVVGVFDRATVVDVVGETRGVMEGEVVGETIVDVLGAAASGDLL